MDAETRYDLAGEVIGFAMKVHRTLGPAFLERVYRKAMEVELQAAGMKFATEAPLMVTYRGVVVGEYYADLLVKDILVVELKAVQCLAVEHEVQLVNYLAATGIEEGLLLNFGGPRLEFKKKFRTYRPTGNVHVD